MEQEDQQVQDAQDGDGESERLAGAAEKDRDGDTADPRKMECAKTKAEAQDILDQKKGPLDEPVDLVVEADWSPGCCVSWDCPGEPEGWEVGRAWMKRRGTWRTVELNKTEIEQVERELGEP